MSNSQSDPIADMQSSTPDAGIASPQNFGVLIGVIVAMTALFFALLTFIWYHKHRVLLRGLEELPDEPPQPTFNVHSVEKRRPKRASIVSPWLPEFGSRRLEQTTKWSEETNPLSEKARKLDAEA
jgi:hypothetical protein